jgi:hypothetical protein
MEEIWKDIEGYGNYEVSSLGKVRNKKTGKVLKGNKNQQVNLRNNNEQLIALTLENLVAAAFCVNPNGYRMVAYKDGNILNKSASNLEYREGMQLLYKKGEKTTSKDTFSQTGEYLSVRLIKDFPKEDGIYIVFYNLEGEIVTTVGYCIKGSLQDRDGEGLIYDSFIGYSELPKIL